MRSGAAGSSCEGLEALARRFPFIREVRGLGLMIGVEIQSETGEPAPGLRDWLIDLAFHRGLLALAVRAEHDSVLPAACA